MPRIQAVRRASNNGINPDKCDIDLCARAHTHTYTHKHKNHNLKMSSLYFQFSNVPIENQEKEMCTGYGEGFSF